MVMKHSTRAPAAYAQDLSAPVKYIPPFIGQQPSPGPVDVRRRRRVPVIRVHQSKRLFRALSSSRVQGITENRPSQQLQRQGNST